VFHLSWFGLFVPYAFISVVFLFGININMSVGGVSLNTPYYTLLTTHESITTLVKKSHELSLICQGEKQHNQCIRPHDYSSIKTHLPIQFEKCESFATFKECDDLRILLSFTTKDILLTGLRK
jgi:hypothetical protein